MSFLNNRFSHIYIEKEVENFDLTLSIKDKLPNAKIIGIKHYKDVFCRTGQDFSLQKKSQKIILAAKKNPFLYKGSEFCLNYGEKEFYYTTPVLNCVYNCEYCFLQGMYASGNIVIFVNQEDFFRDINAEINDKNAYIAISYETDLLALEWLTGIVGKWLDFALKNPNITIEIRTKSPFARFFSDIINPLKNIIISWTISPDYVINKYEKGSPSLNARIRAMSKILDKGWNLRICIDPIIYVENWEKHYKECVEKVFKNIDSSKIFDISLGVFRMGRETLKNARKKNPHSHALGYPFLLINSSYTYPESLREILLGFVYNETNKFIEKEKIFV
jgi:spore photoproduct lyase